KLHLAVDAHGMPVRIVITEGAKHDSTQASFLIEGISAEHLLADKAYESDAILLQLNHQGINPVIPPKSNRREPWPFDKDLYKLRHLVENTLLHLKRWRGIATRYAKNAASFMAAVQIRCIALWGGLF
ncbi:MAG: IS5 family transposase, partial [Simkania sp.]|nr:IS5 family transposase [Simkania sp.]